MHCESAYDCCECDCGCDDDEDEVGAGCLSRGLSMTDRGLSDKIKIRLDQIRSDQGHKSINHA